MPEPAGDVVHSDEAYGCGDGGVERLAGVSRRLLQQALELAPHRLDGIEVRAIGWSTYAQNHSLPLGRFLEDGRLPLDNGEVERLIRLIAIGRNNYLFAGSDAAGQRAAHAYTLVLSCYRLSMDLWAYLRDVLPKLGDTRFPASRLAELLPEAWLQQQCQQL